jgi:hypothetical protein
MGHWGVVAKVGAVLRRTSKQISSTFRAKAARWFRECAPSGVFPRIVSAFVSQKSWVIRSLFAGAVQMIVIEHRVLMELVLHCVLIHVLPA